MTTPEAVAGIVPAWERLAERSGQPAFAFPFWALAAHEHERELAGHTLHVVTVWEGEELLALAPLARRSMLGVGMLRFLGLHHLQGNRFLVAPGRRDALGVLWDELRRAGTLASFDGLDTRVALPPVVGTRPWFGMVERTNRSVLAETKLEVEALLDRDRRKLREVHVARRRAAQRGIVLRHAVARDRGELEAMLPDLASVVRSNGARHEPSPMERTLAGGALPRMLAAAADAGRLVVCLRTAGEVPIAAKVGLVGSGVLTGYLTAHHRDFRELNPGHLVMADFYREGHRLGLPIDLGFGDLMWKSRWGADGYDVVDIVLAPSMAALGALRGRRRLIELAQRIRGRRTGSSELVPAV